MKSVFVFILLSIPLVSSATATKKYYRVEAKIYLGDKLISSPRISTVDGETAKVTQADPNNKASLTFAVTTKSIATATDPDSVRLEVGLERTAKEITLKSHSSLVTSLGEEFVMLSESENSKKPLKVKVKVTR